MDFKALVYETVAAIPPGRVMTYGQIAALCGQPRAARVVGTIAHFGPDELPWHRVVNRQGRLAGEFPGGRTVQAAQLAAEGVTTDAEWRVDIGKLLWNPQQLSE